MSHWCLCIGESSNIQWNKFKKKIYGKIYDCSKTIKNCVNIKKKYVLLDSVFFLIAAIKQVCNLKKKNKKKTKNTTSIAEYLENIGKQKENK